MTFWNNSGAIFSEFQLFTLEVKHFYQKNTSKNSQMQIQLVKMI